MPGPEEECPAWYLLVKAGAPLSMIELNRRCVAWRNFVLAAQSVEAEAQEELLFLRRQQGPSGRSLGG